MIVTANKMDAAPIAKVLVETWQTAFDGIIKPDDIKVDEGFYTKIMDRNISEKLEHILVAKDKHQIIGFISGIEHNDQKLYEIKGFYVLPGFQNKTYGTKLFNKMYDYARDMNVDGIFLKTLKGARNNNFYLKQGLEIDQSFELKIGQNIYECVRYIRMFK